MFLSYCWQLLRFYSRAVAVTLCILTLGMMTGRGEMIIPSARVMTM